MGAVAAIGSSVMALSTIVKAGFDISQGFKDRKAAREANDKSMAAQQGLLDQGKEQMSKADAQQSKYEQEQVDQAATADSNSKRDEARTRQRKLAMQGTSFRDTILTGPEGLAPTGSKGKTLLGT
jgi:hypothetical protein